MVRAERIELSYGWLKGYARNPGHLVALKQE
jgi:hypothetical protein